jgi:hypothetical protein
MFSFISLRYNFFDSSACSIVNFVICVSMLAGSNLGHGLIYVVNRLSCSSHEPHLILLSSQMPQVIGISFCLIIIRLTIETKDSSGDSARARVNAVRIQPGSGDHHPRADVLPSNRMEVDSKDRSVFESASVLTCEDF